MSDVNSPSHYRSGSGIECIDVIIGWGLGFCGGNVLKYVCRVGLKGDSGKDLQKALWYAKRAKREKELSGHYSGRFGLGVAPQNVVAAWGLDGALAQVVVALNFATSDEGWQAVIDQLQRAIGDTA